MKWFFNYMFDNFCLIFFLFFYAYECRQFEAQVIGTLELVLALYILKNIFCHAQMIDFSYSVKTQFCPLFPGKLKVYLLN